MESHGFDHRTYAAQLLQSGSVRFRALQDTDATALVRWWQEPQLSILQHPKFVPRGTEALETMFRSWGSGAPGVPAAFSVIDQNREEMVGCVALFAPDASLRSATLSLMIGTEYQGRGYGTESIRLLTRYGLLELGFNRIEAQVFAYNKPALAAFRKAGFVQEGVRREVVFHGGQFHDDVILSALSSDLKGSLNRPRFDAVSFRVWKENIDHAEKDSRGDEAACDAARS